MTNNKTKTMHVLQRDTLHKNFKPFVDMVRALRTHEQFEGFFFGILTPKEIKELSLRIEIVKQIMQGIPHATIAKNLGVGVATVTRGSKEIAKGSFSSIDPNYWR